MTTTDNIRASCSCSCCQTCRLRYRQRQAKAKAAEEAEVRAKAEAKAAAAAAETKAKEKEEAKAKARAKAEAEAAAAAVVGGNGAGACPGTVCSGCEQFDCPRRSTLVAHNTRTTQWSRPNPPPFGQQNLSSGSGKKRKRLPTSGPSNSPRTNVEPKKSKRYSGCTRGNSCGVFYRCPNHTDKEKKEKKKRIKSLIGRSVRRRFPGYGYYDGSIMSFARGKFLIAWSDGTSSEHIASATHKMVDG